MNVSDYISPQLVFLDLDISNKMDLLVKVVDLIANHCGIKKKDQVLRLLLEREGVMTTGIGKGFAIPHTFTEEVDKTIIAYFRVKKGVDYDALDKKPVINIFLLLGPNSSQGLHLRLLAKLSRLMNKPEFDQHLKEVQSPDEFVKIIEKEEERFSFNPQHNA